MLIIWSLLSGLIIRHSLVAHFVPFLVHYEFIIGDLCELCVVTTIVMIFRLWL